MQSFRIGCTRAGAISKPYLSGFFTKNYMPAIKDKLKMQDRPPRWCGFVSDGYGVRDGKLYFEPINPSARHQQEYALLETECILLEYDLLKAGLLPVVSARALHGEKPTQAQIQTLCNALSRLPLVFRQAILERGQKIEAVPGKNAREHPKFNGSGGRAALGLVDGFGKMAVVTTDSLAVPMVEILYHEVGHLISLTRPLQLSKSKLWLKIWKQDLAAGMVPNTNDQQKISEEYFAECFSKYYLSTTSRESLSLEVRRYFNKLQSRFGCPS